MHFSDRYDRGANNRKVKVTIMQDNSPDENFHEEKKPGKEATENN